MTHHPKTWIPALGLLLALAGGNPAQATNAYAPGYLPIDEALEGVALDADVNVHFPKFLLNDMAEDLKQSPDNPLASIGVDPHALIRDLRRVRLMVLEVNDANRQAVRAAAAKLEQHLRADWLPVVRVSEENVGIYTAGDAAGQKMAGLAVLIVQDDTAVFANIEGSLPFGLILKLATNFKALPPDFLGQITGQATDQTEAPVLETDEP